MSNGFYSLTVFSKGFIIDVWQVLNMSVFPTTVEECSFCCCFLRFCCLPNPPQFISRRLWRSTWKKEVCIAQIDRTKVVGIANTFHNGGIENGGAQRTFLDVSFSRSWRTLKELRNCIWCVIICVFIILFDTDLWKSTFSPYYFKNKAFRLFVSCIFCLLCFQLVVIKLGVHWRKIALSPMIIVKKWFLLQWTKF